MFHNRKLNNHVNRIHKRSLKIVFKDHDPTFKDILAEYDSLKINDLNLRDYFLKYLNGACPRNYK